MDNRPIGVFDSGLGGLTAVKELRRILPGEDIVFFGDTARVPYGTRSHETIVQYSRQAIRFLLEKDVKFLLAACGTISSNYPSAEAARLPVPYTGVVGCASRAAVRATRSGRIGVIATAATIRSGSYVQTIRETNPGMRLYPKACPLFVPLVENGFFSAQDPVAELVAARYLQELKDNGVDTLILGCTHYPLLAPVIGRFMGPHVALIDSGRETALAVRDALADLDLLAAPGHAGSASYFVSDTADGFGYNAALFLGEYAGGPIARISIENYDEGEIL